MQLDAPEIDDPRQARRVVNDDFFRGSSRRKRQRDGSQPIRSVLGRALLIEGLTLGAIDEALQHVRAVADSRDGSRSDGQIVLDHVQLGELDVAREIGFAWIAYADVAAIDREQ